MVQEREVPYKKREDNFPSGNVVILRPADPQKLAAYHKEQARIHKVNPNYIPDHKRFAPKPFGPTVMKKDIYHVYG